MKRLGNSVVSRTQGEVMASLKLMGGESNSVKFNLLAMSKLGLSTGSYVDLLEGDIQGEFFVVKTQTAGEGRKVSKMGTINSSSIYAFLNKYGKVFEITDVTIEFDGLTWNKLRVVPIAATPVTQAEAPAKKGKAAKAETKAEAVVEKDNF